MRRPRWTLQAVLVVFCILVLLLILSLMHLEQMRRELNDVGHSQRPAAVGRDVDGDTLPYGGAIYAYTRAAAVVVAAFVALVA